MPKDIEVGRIELAYGPMFSHKTEWLIKELDGYKRGHYNVAAFKPKLDNRYSAEEISSHSGQRFPAFLISSAKDIVQAAMDHPAPHIIGIEEAQFLDDLLLTAVDDLRARGKIVLINGLLTTFANEPFPFSLGNGKRTMADLLAIVDDAVRCYAICTYQQNGVTCGRRDATRTQRLFPDGKPVPYDDPLIVVGSDKEHERMEHPRIYEARCSQHHFFSHDGEALTLQELRKRQAAPQC